MSHPIDNYINYKNENVAIYTKKEFENQNIYEHMVGKVRRFWSKYNRIHR